MTPATRAAMVPARTASSNAVMFEPRPEIRITRRFMLPGAMIDASDDDGTRRARFPRHDAADRERGLAQRVEPRDHRRGGRGADHQHQPDAAVEDPMHFVVVDVSLLLQPAEYRRSRPATRVD